MTKKVFSLDAETNGLWGQAFAIGAVIYEDGREVKTFYAVYDRINIYFYYFNLTILYYLF